MGEDHVLTQIIKRCLSNVPDERPSALQALDSLNQISKSRNEPNDIYHKYQHVSRLDLVKMAGDDPHMYSDQKSSFVHKISRGRAEELSQLVDSSPNRSALDHTLEKFEKIKASV